MRYLLKESIGFLTRISLLTNMKSRAMEVCPRLPSRLLPTGAATSKIVLGAAGVARGTVRRPLGTSVVPPAVLVARRPAGRPGVLSRTTETTSVPSRLDAGLEVVMTAATRTAVGRAELVDVPGRPAAVPAASLELAAAVATRPPSTPMAVAATTVPVATPGSVVGVPVIGRPAVAIAGARLALSALTRRDPRRITETVLT